MNEITSEVLLRSVVRWAHILSAVVLLGGIFFLRYVQLPASKTLGDEEARQLNEASMRRWRRSGIVLRRRRGGHDKG